MKTGSLSQERKKNLRLFLRRMTARKIVLFGLIGTLFFVILALFAPLIATADPNEMAMLDKLADPSSAHWFGTDMYRARHLFPRGVRRTGFADHRRDLGIAGIDRGLLPGYAGRIQRWHYRHAADALLRCLLCYPADCYHYGAGFTLWAQRCFHGLHNGYFHHAGLYPHDARLLAVHHQQRVYPFLQIAGRAPSKNPHQACSAQQYFSHHHYGDPDHRHHHHDGKRLEFSWHRHHGTHGIVGHHGQRGPSVPADPSAVCRGSLHLYSAVIVENKSGRGAILADRIVDATGDGDVAALAGAAYEKGENNNGKVLPVTMVFGVSGVDTKTFRDYIESHPEMTNPDTHGLKLPFRRAKADGKWPVERDGGAWKELTPTGEFTSLNLTLENGIDGTNVWDLTHAEIQGRQQVMWAVDVLRNYAKEMGFANCSLRSIAGQIGIRETRRIQGGYSICRRDVLGHSEFDDSIGVYTTFIDGEVVSKDDAHFQLPYRMILPNGIENLSVSGRCASCDDDAIQTVRMMVCCATTGQAAGTASALSIKDDVVLRDLDIHTLQNQLVADGVRIR